MECFPDLLALFHIFIWERALRKHLGTGRVIWKKKKIGDYTNLQSVTKQNGTRLPDGARWQLMCHCPVGELRCSAVFNLFQSHSGVMWKQLFHWEMPSALLFALLLTWKHRPVLMKPVATAAAAFTLFRHSYTVASSSSIVLNCTLQQSLTTFIATKKDAVWFFNTNTGWNHFRLDLSKMDVQSFGIEILSGPQLHCNAAINTELYCTHGKDLWNLCEVLQLLINFLCVN